MKKLEFMAYKMIKKILNMSINQSMHTKYYLKQKYIIVINAYVFCPPLF